MAQTKILSGIEAVSSALFGITVSVLLWPIAGWIFGVEASTGQSIGMVVFFTTVGMVKNYITRRVFNYLETTHENRT